MPIIRKAKKKDRADVLLLAEALATSYVVDCRAFEKAFEHALNDPREVVFVAKQGEECIGFCLGSIHTTFYANGDIAWLEELYVSPEYRRSGVGKKLVSSFENSITSHSLH